MSINRGDHKGGEGISVYCLCFVLLRAGVWDSRGVSGWQRALQGVVVAIFGLAELVKEKDDGLKAEN